MRAVARGLALALTLLQDGAVAQPIVRGLLAPTAEGPAEVKAGDTLAIVVQVASGLTPPPGVQTERALRGFALRLCESAEGAGSSACTGVTVRNVRPTDAHSLSYRVEAPLPSELRAGVYDLEVRFPGGSDRLARGVHVGPGDVDERGGNERFRLSAAAHGSVAARCALASRPMDVGGWCLLLLALSWKLGANRRRHRRKPLE